MVTLDRNPLASFAGEVVVVTPKVSGQASMSLLPVNVWVVGRIFLEDPKVRDGHSAGLNS